MSILEPQFQFKWNKSISVESNFSEWWTLNCEERRAFGEEVLTKEEAIKIFEEIHNVSVDNS